MKRKLIFIIGNSGSGKDTVADYLCRKYGYHKVPSYTTRPKRKDERDGDTHVFVHWGSVAHRPDVWCTSHGFSMFAWTYFGGHYYFATRQQLKESDKTVYIIDEKGLKDVLDDAEKRGWLNDNFDWQAWHLTRTAPDIEESRTLRDADRITLPDEFYRYAISNDYDADYLLSAVDACMKAESQRI